MTDFNFDATVGRTAEDLVKMNILARKWNLTEAWAAYKQMKANGIKGSLSHIIGRTQALFDEMQGTLIRRANAPKNKAAADKITYDELKRICRSSQDEIELMAAFDYISELLDEIQITRLDNKKVYDGTRTETENKMKGY